MAELVTGGKALQRALNELPGKLQRRGIGKAAGKAAAVIVRQAKANAPKASGALKRNIKRESWRSRYYAKVFAIGVAHGPVPKNVGGGLGVLESRSGKLTIKTLSARERRGDDPFYFRWQELGWHHAKSGKRIAPTEYLQDAIKQKRAEAIRVYGDVLNVEVNKLGKPA